MFFFGCHKIHADRRPAGRKSGVGSRMAQGGAKKTDPVSEKWEAKLIYHVYSSENSG